MTRDDFDLSEGNGLDDEGTEEEESMDEATPEPAAVGPSEPLNAPVRTKAGASAGAPQMIIQSSVLDDADLDEMYLEVYRKFRGMLDLKQWQVTDPRVPLKKCTVEELAMAIYRCMDDHLEVRGCRWSWELIQQMLTQFQEMEPTFNTLWGRAAAYMLELCKRVERRNEEVKLLRAEIFKLQKETKELQEAKVSAVQAAMRDAEGKQKELETVIQSRNKLDDALKFTWHDFAHEGVGEQQWEDFKVVCNTSTDSFLSGKAKGMGFLYSNFSRTEGGNPPSWQRIIWVQTLNERLPECRKRFPDSMVDSVFSKFIEFAMAPPQRVTDGGGEGGSTGEMGV